MSEQVPTIKPALKKLIQDSLKQRYTSVSSKDSVETGNHYQSITLGDERTTGFRSSREEFLDRVDFTGKRVLDLGANLGEISRAVRGRGATLVDGYEYDSFFVEMAQAVNAYNGTTRVSFYERDITDSTIYREHYEIVLAFSVFVYLTGVLPALAEITDGVLVLETHRLEGNLESTYLNPIGRLFPHHVILGPSDWGRGHDADGQRAVIVFAKTDESLRSHVRGLGAAGRHFSTGRRPGTEVDIHTIDVDRTPWYDRFFKRFEFKSPEELLAAIERMDFDIDSLAQNGDPAVTDMAGWAYWVIYLKGALEGGNGKTAGPGNVYYDLLAQHGNDDLGRVPDYNDPSRLASVVHRRFSDFDIFRTHLEAPIQTAPPRLVVTQGPPTPRGKRNVARIYEVGSEVPVETTTIDGFHRLFLARLFRHKQVPCDFVAEDDAVPDPSA
jgi:hypothetical protein